MITYCLFFQVPLSPQPLKDIGEKGKKDIIGPKVVSDIKPYNHDLGI
jgi:hypothetical protein